MKILLSISALVISTSLIAAESTSGIMSNSQRLPPEGAAWSGTSSHVFLGGQAVLFCGTHGTLSGNSDPPTTRGSSIEIEYSAVFTGELTLTPPLVRQTQVITLQEPIRMVERITNTGQRGNVVNYSAELITVEFDETAFPRNIRIRESLERASSGRVTTSVQSRGNFSIQANYNVWLEISVDAGRSWNLANEAVTMQLVPEVNNATITPVPRVIRRQR